MDSTRRHILTVHGSILVLLGLANALLSTLGTFWGVGPMSYLASQPLMHIGLLQAYLLAALLGAVLLLGARQPRPVVFDWIGALTHLAILTVYVLYWDAFPTVAPGFENVRAFGLVHLALAALEGWAIVDPLGRRQPRVAGVGSRA
jgi:hypothetical protein